MVATMAGEPPPRTFARLRPEPAEYRRAAPAPPGPPSDALFRRDRAAWLVPPRDAPCPGASAAAADLRKLVSRPYQQDQVARALREWLPRRDWARALVVDGMAHVGTDSVGLFVERLGAGRVAPIEIRHEFAELLAENVRDFPAVDFPRCGDFYSLWAGIVREGGRGAAGANAPLVFLDPMWTAPAIARALAELPALAAAGAIVVLKLPPDGLDAAAAAARAAGFATRARWVEKTWQRRRGERDFAVVLARRPAPRELRPSAPPFVPPPTRDPRVAWRPSSADFPALSRGAPRSPGTRPPPAAAPPSP
jgi:hypothetical protein